ncbi:MAG: hypothetical protein AAF790_06805 [Planctomycetota bacterium]
MLRTVLNLPAAGLLLAMLAVPASTAEAQFGVRYGFGGVRVSTPAVGVRVGPFGGVRVRAPGAFVRTPGRVVYGPPRPAFGYGYGYGGSYFYSGPGVTVSGYAAPGGPVVGGPVVTGGRVISSGSVVTGGRVVASGSVVTGTPTPAAGSIVSGGVVTGSTSGAVVTSAKPAATALASEAELAAMGGIELIAATAEASAALQSRLDGFQNGEGWQTYLAFDAETAGDLAAADKLLRRFDSVARDAQFAMIYRLSEFQALRTALRVMVDRGGVDIAVGVPGVGVDVGVSTQGESLPVPAADAEPSNPTAADVDVDVSAGGVRVKVERSILTPAE